MRILCYDKNDDKAVIQLTDRDLEDMEKARPDRRLPVGGKLAEVLRDVDEALLWLNAKPGAVRRYTASVPMRTAVRLLVLISSAHACLTLSDWEAMLT